MVKTLIKLIFIAGAGAYSFGVYQDEKKRRELNET